MKKFQKIKATRKIHKLHVGVNDKVLIITGDDKGHEGLIINVDRKRFKVKVSGANLLTHFIKSNNDSQEKKTPITEKKEGWIHVSNVKLIKKYEKKSIKENNE